MPTAHQDAVAKSIIQAYYRVYDALGAGFLEKVYENALAIELRSRGHHVRQQCPICVYYQGYVVGEYFADLCVDNCVIVEPKAVDYLVLEHEAQLLNYLRSSDVTLGLLVNFGRDPKVKRKVYESSRSVKSQMASVGVEVANEVGVPFDAAK
jgi:GxxExxY protein